MRASHLIRLAAYVLFTAVAALHPLRAHGQTAPYKFDGGVSLGVSGYLGDANRTALMKHPGWVGEITGRYIIDSRWALRGLISGLGLSGNTADISDVLPTGEHRDFTATVAGLEVRGEFNFFAYGMGETYKRLRRWSPYMHLGMGMCLSMSGGSTAAAATLPMGVGVKYKLSERLNLMAEFTMTKAFSDRIDGPGLHDLNEIKIAFYKSTDWYSRLTVGITYEFGRRCETCHYVE